MDCDCPGNHKSPHCALAHWLEPNSSNNESGFTAFGAGRRLGYNGTFVELKENGHWWATDIYAYNGKAYGYRIGYNTALNMGFTNSQFNNGNSVRCVKD